MKKSFYFALALTAGLFASCSSDDISQAPGLSGQENYGNAEKTPIVINVSGAGVTRGTGTVGDIDGAKNVWAGQSFNLFMFQNGSFIPARIARTEGAAATDIYNDAELTTPKAANGQATYTLNNVVTATYYPDGQFDFWAYRIDDAWIDGTGLAGWEGDAQTQPDKTTKQVIGVATETAASAASYTWVAYTGQDAATLNGPTDPTTATVGTVGAIYENTTSGDMFKCTVVTPAGEAGWNDAATTVAIPFKINGSQDIMIGTAKAPTGWTKTTADGTLTPDEDYYLKGTDKVPVSKVFSAYAARRGFNPSLAFTHQLTRLTFEVEAASRKVSEAASCLLSPIPANWEPGFTITGITVRSKSKGQLVVAHKGDAPASYIDWTKDETGAASTEKWDTPNSLALLNLMSREKAVDEKAKIAFVEANKTDGNVEVVSTANYYENINDATVKFTAKTTGSKTMNQWVGLGLVYNSKDTDPLTGEATGTVMTTTNWDTAPLTNGKVYILVVADGYHADNATTWDKCTYSNNENANIGLVALENVKPGWKDLAKKYTEITASATADQKQAAGNAVTTAPSGDPQEALGTLIRYDNGTAGDATDDIYYLVEADETTNAGQAVATKVGEALLVAPADANGYEITIHYTRSKINSATDIQNLPDSKTIVVTRKSQVSGTPTDFEIGSTYNIKIKLFEDASPEFEVEKPNPWNQGTGTESSYSAE